jgi:hypothetical protein
MKPMLLLALALPLTIACTQSQPVFRSKKQVVVTQQERPPTENIPTPVNEQPPSLADGVKVAFIGDTQTGSGFQSVLDLIRAEKADLVIVSGDTDYGSGEGRWDRMVRDTLPGEVALVAMGNHDYGDSNASTVKSMGRARLQENSQMKCAGEYGEKMSCTFRGLFIVISSIGSGGGSQSEHEQYIQSQLNAAPEGHWRICAWHKNQRQMQVGGKDDDVGWTAYESCRQSGALIATGHEHSYSRTHSLSSMQSRTIASMGPEYQLTEGTTIAWVSGLGGRSIRDQQLAGNHWASIYTSNQGAVEGALFGTFKGNTANFVFKNVNNQVIDQFTVSKGY